MRKRRIQPQSSPLNFSRWWKGWKSRRIGTNICAMTVVYNVPVYSIFEQCFQIVVSSVLFTFRRDQRNTCCYIEHATTGIIIIIIWGVNCLTLHRLFLLYSTLQNQRNIPVVGGAIKNAQIDKSTKAGQGGISAVTAKKNIKTIGSPQVLAD